MDPMGGIKPGTGEGNLRIGGGGPHYKALNSAVS
jgi:hypothetical protein